MDDRAELIERLKKLTGPDREVDVAILPYWQPDHEALQPWPAEYRTEVRDGGFSAWKEGFSISAPFPRFTTSRDAAVALILRVNPDAYYASGRTAAYPGMIPGSVPQRFFGSVGSWGEPIRCYHDVEAIALLIALLRSDKEAG